MTTIVTPNMTTHITTPQYDDPPSNHMPKHNICYNQIIIVSFHVDPPQYGPSLISLIACVVDHDKISILHLN